MTNQLKVIPTRYRGYNFRSRLEARWAIYFDNIGIKWEYEKEGFNLDGINYLPDFWLPEVNMWAEVKPEEFTEIETHKANLLVKYTGFPMLMLTGTPERKVYSSIEFDSSHTAINQEDWEKVGLTSCYYVLTNYHNYPKEEGRFFALPAYNSAKEDIDNSEWDVFFEDTKKAVEASRSARFEFDEEKNDL